jgi:uncharacterized protein (TIGR02145 family)
MTRCGGTSAGSTYTPGTEECCGSNKYTIATQFCSASAIYSKCGGKDYNPENQRCEGNVVETQCGTYWYNAANTNLRCQSNVVEIKCGAGSNFHNPATQFCDGDEVLNKCNNEIYDPTAKGCCNNTEYTLSTQFCYQNSKVGSKCSINPQTSYDPDLYQCKENSNGIYLKNEKPKDANGKEYEAVMIGEQVWMAENLNYKASGSKCGTATGSITDDNTEYCNTYGRLYNWATAMNGSASSSANPSGRQGVCPAGWHLPSDAEWDVLVQYVDPDWTSNSSGGNVAGTKLKAKSGWNSNGNGMDEFGFSALPGGYGGSSGTFYSVGLIGHWWSTTEYDATNAYDRYMYNSDVYVRRSSNGKSNFISVRCLQD